MTVDIFRVGVPQGGEKKRNRRVGYEVAGVTVETDDVGRVAGTRKRKKGRSFRTFVLSPCVPRPRPRSLSLVPSASSYWLETRLRDTNFPRRLPQEDGSNRKREQRRRNVLEKLMTGQGEGASRHLDSGRNWKLMGAGKIRESVLRELSHLYHSFRLQADPRFESRGRAIHGRFLFLA